LSALYGEGAQRSAASETMIFSLGIQNFKAEEAARSGRSEALITPSGISSQGLTFVDPDGKLVQLNAPGYGSAPQSVLEDRAIEIDGER
jgi:hypothetical protein